MINLSGKIILITGASTGIGASVDDEIDVWTNIESGYIVYVDNSIIRVCAQKSFCWGRRQETG
ncbi:MAG: hypothetical protein F6K48_25340, partial [Okeania sp. SIO3H1]|nr:hypothetical protein [Okeania sp. SIO3H1]